MRGFHDFLRCTGALVSDLALCLLAAALCRALQAGDVLVLPVLPWLAVFEVQTVINLILIRRGLSVNGYLVWNTAVVAAGTAAVVLLTARGQYGEDYGLLIGAGAAVTFIHAAAASWYLPKANGLLRYVDCLIVALAFYLYTTTQLGRTMDAAALTICMAAVILDLLAINQIRTHEEDVSIISGAAAASRIVLLLLVLAIFVVTGLVVGFASGQIHSAVDIFLWLATIAARMIGTVFSVIGKILATIILFILMLLPTTSPRIQENARMELFGETAEMAEESSAGLPLWLQITFAAVIVLALFALALYQFRGRKLGRMRRPQLRRSVKRTGHLWEALRELAKKIAAAITFEFQYRKNRCTPAGLLVYADRAGKRHLPRVGKKARQRPPLCRLPGESPGEYMRRLGLYSTEEQKGEPEDGRRLRQLGERMDEYYYQGRGEVLTREDCREYEAVLRRCLGHGGS